MSQTTPDVNTVAGLIAAVADEGRAAIAAPDRPAMTYAGLRRQIEVTQVTLWGNGIGAADRVAIVLPNGPEMASAFVTIAAACCTAPLNPAYTADEFDFYLGDLGVRAIVLAHGVDSPARQVAIRRGLLIFDCMAGEDAGAFTLLGSRGIAQAWNGGPPGPRHTALILHTSGTTSRPKIVPLTQANIAASARHIAASLALTPADHCLNVMPLFHIHGLVAAVLASLSAGAAICCTPGFNAFRFFSWFAAQAPTWYTAVPTMHQALLPLAARNADTIAAGKLRLVRSSSASLPPQVMTALEAAFGVPVIEAYGMTEASHQMASNPLPPRARHPGSVGVAAGPEIAILGEGALLPPDAIGEVVIRGPNVTTGYENNPAANATAFWDGWFRTGDQGFLDPDGYLRLTGRLKEIISRGGEKISPLEVDTVLMDHPAVAQCVTFAVPHDKLGEEVGVAIVLHEGEEATDHGIREFAATRLAPFKVPRHVVFMGEIPKGATGKLQRIGLADKLGLGVKT